MEFPESRLETDNSHCKHDSSFVNTDESATGEASVVTGPFPLRCLSPWPVCAGTLFVFISTYLLTQDLFILNEARSYFVNGGWTSGITASQYWLFPAGYNTRFTSMFFANFVTHACGVSIGCTNMLQSCLVALAFGAIVIHTFQLVGSLRLTFFVAGLWALSAPALSGAIWQSIQHDKIALILTMLTLTLSVEFFSRGNRSRWEDGSCSLVLTGLFAVAFNAKEVAFLLPICGVFLAVILSMKSGGSVVRSLLVMTLPMAYSAWFIGFYLIHLDSTWANHISGGSPLAGARTLLLLSLNLGNFLNLGQWGDYNKAALGVAKHLYLTFVVVLAVLALYRALKWRRPKTGFIAGARNAALTHWRELYLLLICSVSQAAFARTAVPSAFYMMIPFWSGTLLIILILRILVAAIPRPRLAFGFLLVLMAAPLLVSYTTQYGPGGAVRRLLQSSHSLETSFGAIRVLLPVGQVKAIRMSVAGTPDCSWYLLHGMRGENLDADLGPYIFNKLSARPIMIDGNDPARIAKPPLPGEADIRLADDYSLLSVSFDGKLVFRHPEP